MPQPENTVNKPQPHSDEQPGEPLEETVLEEWDNPPHQGEPNESNGHGSSTGSCGDTIHIFLRIEDDVVRDAGFLTDGCGSSIISGSTTAELALRKHCEELMNITGEVVRDSLGDILKEDEHCAFLAANALHDAVGDYYRRLLRNEHVQTALGRNND